VKTDLVISSTWTFLHAYDRVCLDYVDKVLEIMNFGPGFRSAVATLHREATACFLLQRPSADIPVKFSIRQGDPLSLPLFVIQQEPFLWRLHNDLPGLTIGEEEVKEEGYVDDVDALGDNDSYFPIIDTICR
jgi:hypothetical protein